MTDDTNIPDDSELEIEIVDDTPEEDRGRPRRPEGTTPEVPADDELENYSEGVKKRISKLKYEFHEERRRAEEAIRLQQEAVAFAQRQQQELDRMRQQLQRGDEALVTQAQQRMKTELEQAQAKMKAAYEAGDADGVVAANTRIAELKAEEAKFSIYRPRPQQQQPAPVAPPQPVQAPQPAYQPQVAPPSTRARDWATRNTWFMRNEEMTALALGVHERSIKQGVAPDSEEYYNAIDTAVRQRFPEMFSDAEESAPRRKSGSVVAPGGRSTAAAPRKVTLTATQVALAKRLGLTPEQYAAQLMKERKNG